jgi:hypothetical protein
MKLVKRRLFLLSLILFGFCFSLFLMEVSIRVFFPHSRDYVTPGGLFDFDDYLGWKLMAGKSHTHHSSYFEVVYAINSLGYRDKPRNLQKDENIYRILLYGDSQIFGWGVPEDKRFSNLIENQKRHFEIWNLAVPGYGLDQEILSYDKYGQSMNGDEVIFFISDLTLERTQYNYYLKKPKPIFVTDNSGALKFIPIPKEKTVTINLLYKILSPMYLPYFLERQFDTLSNILKKFSYGNRDQVTNKEIIIPKDRVGDFEKKMIIMARNTALKGNQKITILAELPESKRKDLKVFCMQNGIGFLTIIFDDKKIEDLVIGEHDQHWNPQAHKLIAEQFLSQLEKNLDR